MIFEQLLKYVQPYFQRVMFLAIGGNGDRKSDVMGTLDKIKRFAILWYLCGSIYLTTVFLLIHALFLKIHV